MEPDRGLGRDGRTGGCGQRARAHQLDEGADKGPAAFRRGMHATNLAVRETGMPSEMASGSGSRPGGSARPPTADGARHATPRRLRPFLALPLGAGADTASEALIGTWTTPLFLQSAGGTTDHVRERLIFGPVEDEIRVEAFADPALTPPLSTLVSRRLRPRRRGASSWTSSRSRGTRYASTLGIPIAA